MKVLGNGKRVYIVYYGETATKCKEFIRFTEYVNARNVCDFLVKCGYKSYVALLEYRGNVL